MRASLFLSRVLRLTERVCVCRNHVPWAILSACWFATAVLIMVTRVYLARENGKRDAEGHDATYDEVYISQEKADGTKEDVKVDKVRSSLSSRPSISDFWIIT